MILHELIEKLHGAGQYPDIRIQNQNVRSRGRLKTLVYGGGKSTVDAVLDEIDPVPKALNRFERGIR